MSYKYLFGPVPSRRLGLSLGIDLFPSKICSYDCPYCECGPTTTLTTERKEYVPTQAVIEELTHFLQENPSLDVITFAGSGEPTLHSGIKQIIQFLKKNYPQYKVVLLSNGSLFFDPEVRKDVLDCDIISPSLDALSFGPFSKINKPAAGLSSDSILQGIIQLRQEFKGTFWIEIFIVPGINNQDHELSVLRQALLEINPEEIHLNTLDRPGSAASLKKATPEEMQDIAAKLNLPQVVVVSKPSGKAQAPQSSLSLEEQVKAIICRRPCTIEDLVAALGASQQEVVDVLANFKEQGLVQEYAQNRGLFYRFKA